MSFRDLEICLSFISIRCMVFLRMEKFNSTYFFILMFFLLRKLSIDFLAKMNSQKRKILKNTKCDSLMCTIQHLHQVYL